MSASGRKRILQYVSCRPEADVPAFIAQVHALRYRADTFRFNRYLHLRDFMFNFFHPKPVVDGRAVEVMIVHNKASALQDTRTLIVATRNTAPTGLNAKDESCEK